MRLLVVREQDDFTVSLSKVFKSETQDFTLRFCIFRRTIVRVLSFRLLLAGLCRQYKIKKTKILSSFYIVLNCLQGQERELQKN